MPKLVLSMDGLVLKEIVLNKERITIGRKPTNDVQIDNLAVSGEHAVITTILGDAFLEDRNSTNGTYVNGQPIKKHVLQDNDVIELGKYKLKFLADAVKSPETDYAESTVLRSVVSSAASGFKPDATSDMMSDTTQVLPVHERETALNEVSLSMQKTTVLPSGAAEFNRLGVLQVLSGPNKGRELELVKSLTTLGKPGEQVEVITRRSQGYFLTHVEGVAYPFVNGKPIDDQAVKLIEQDVLEIAGVKMAFYYKA